MSDATERPRDTGTPAGASDEASPAGPQQAGGSPDADAWATACAEDLASEKARRRAGKGAPPGSAADELRRLVDVVADRLTGLSGPGASLLGLAGQGAAQQVVRQAVRQAKAVVEPVIDRNPDVFDHLATAGFELLAAYRSAVEAQESRWTRDEASGPRDKGSGDGDEGSGPGEHIDLD